MIGRSARHRSTRKAFNIFFPQITQIDADMFFCVDLRHLRHLRADVSDDYLGQSRFVPRNLPEIRISTFCAVDDLRVGIKARPGEPVDRSDGNAFEART